MTRAALTMLTACLLGCGGAPEPQPDWGRDPAPEVAAGEAAVTSAAAVGSLTLGRALATVDAEHPELAELRAYVAAAEGRGEQAGVFPNPTLVLRMENAPWSSGSTRDEAEYVAGFSLQLPLSGRLGAAEDAAAREVDQRLQELAHRRLELHGDVRGAFATALSLERAAAIQTQAHDLAARAVVLLEARVEAGDAVPADLARVEIEATRARLEQQRVEGLRQRALLGLATALGDPSLRIDSLTGELEAALELPSLEALTLSLEQNPQVQAAEAEVALEAARVELAKVQWIPDVSLDLFYRRLEETDQHAFDAGVGIPFPLLDRGAGAVRSAQAEQRAAEARARATRNELVRDLRATHARLALLLQATRTMREELLRRADTVLANAEARFEAGDASLTEVLPVRRDWARIQLGYVDALREVMLAWSDLQVLAGVPPASEE